MMDRSNSIDACPKCGSSHYKSWPELTDEEKFLAERLPMSADYPLRTRKKHRFCTRCWFESVIDESRLA